MRCLLQRPEHIRLVPHPGRPALEELRAEALPLLPEAQQHLRRAPGRREPPREAHQRGEPAPAAEEHRCLLLRPEREAVAEPREHVQLRPRLQRVQ